MSSVGQTLARTVKTNIVLYSTDNRGRDGYITYNNGGFWKDNIKQIKMKANFPRHMYYNFHSLIHQAAPFNYYSDGSGRDTYVIKNNAGLVKEFNPLAKRQILSKYLRGNMPISYNKKPKYEKKFLTPSDREIFIKNHNIQNRVVKRLYDQSLGRFRQRMKSSSPAARDSFNSINNSHNLPTINNEFPLKSESNKNISQTMMENKKINNRMKKNIINQKMNKTTSNFYPSNKGKKMPILEDLKINNSNCDNCRRKDDFYTVNNTCQSYRENIKDKDNLKTLRNDNWNPILNNFNTLNNYPTIVESYSNRTNKKEKKKNLEEENKSSNLNDIEKNNLIEDKVFKPRPRSFRKIFEKTQIFNRFKPFLVDDFHDYAGYKF